VLVSGYGFDTSPDFGKLSFAEKLAESRKSIERLHPGHGKELEKPMYVNWGMIPYNEGAWISSYGKMQHQEMDKMSARGSGPARQNWQLAMTQANYQMLLQPDGPIYFAGDHVSHIVGWQEGAALSSQRAVSLISERVKAARLASRPAATA
jgi:monoamine oxidase